MTTRELELFLATEEARVCGCADFLEAERKQAMDVMANEVKRFRGLAKLKEFFSEPDVQLWSDRADAMYAALNVLQTVEEERHNRTANLSGQNS